MKPLSSSQLKYKLETLELLQIVLDGKCSSETCPAHCIRGMALYLPNINSCNGWNCQDCKLYFGFLIEYNGIGSPCPCLRCTNKNEPIIALKEQIQEFKRQLSKRWED